MPIATQAAHLIAELFSRYGDWGIVFLGLPVAYYQPIGPDLLIILKGLSGGNAFISGWLAVAFTLLGTLGGFVPAKRFGRRIVQKIFKRKMSAFQRFDRMFTRYGAWFVFASAFGPIPLKYAIWLAGLSDMPLSRFIFLVIIGLLPRFLGEATLVTLYGDWVREHLARLVPGILPA